MVVPAQGELAAECRRDDIPVFVVPMPVAGWLRKEFRTGIRRLREIIRVTDAAVLHADSALAMRYAGWAGRLEGRRVIWHVRTHVSEGLSDRLLSSLAHRIVVNSKLVASRFPFVRKDRLLCIYSGVDLDGFPPPSFAARDAVRRRLGIPLNVPLVLSVGRLAPGSGYGALLDAIGQVTAARADVHWVIVEGGEERAVVEARCRELGLHERVHLIGPGESMPEVLAACDVFVAPSLHDVFGRVLVEAMSMRKAVVAPKSGGAPEIVVPGETGLLVPLGDVTALAHGISNLLANPNLAEYFGHNGRSRVEHQFTLTRHVETVSGVYDALVA